MEIAQRIIMAKAEINAAVNRTAEKYELPPCIMELVVNGALSDIRGQTAIISMIEKYNRREEKTKIKEEEKHEND